ncbi:MAG: hypothetical protein PHS73_04040 [Candidatus Peribacteraceae bacterium]|nr:hypothetical protein [Candidatus Peribacteraceae bacterium]
MTTPLGALLSGSWAQFRRGIVPIIIGAVVFGLLLGIGQSFMGRRVQESAGTAFQQFGIDLQEMQALQQRMEQGDEAAVEEFTQRMQDLQERGPAFAAQGAGMVFARMAPYLGVSVLVSILISIIAGAYFLVLALDEKLDYSKAAKRGVGVILPLFLLWLWVVIRSFVWIPVLGIILAIILLPRFIVAPVLVVRDGKGVLESASRSYVLTRGYWGKIFGNGLVAGICACIAMLVVAFLLGIFGSAGAMLLPVANMLATAFMTIFVVQLALTVEAHPLVARR